MADQATFRIWRGDNGNGKFVDYTTEISSGMVVLDAVHSIQQQQATISHLEIRPLAPPSVVKLPEQFLPLPVGRNRLK